VLSQHAELVQALVVTPGYCAKELDADRRLRGKAKVQASLCTDAAFASLSDVEAPQGILAVVRQPQWDPHTVLCQPSLFGIFGERLQDPLNVGAIIRTGAALGVSALWLTPDSADIFNPKVVRATSGALLSLPVFHVNDVVDLVKTGCLIYAADANGPNRVPMDRIVRVPPRCILAVGNEGQGLSETLRRSASRLFTIPLDRRVESLNVAATTAIATYYLMHLPIES